MPVARHLSLGRESSRLEVHPHRITAQQPEVMFVRLVGFHANVCQRGACACEDRPPPARLDHSAQAGKRDVPANAASSCVHVGPDVQPASWTQHTAGFPRAATGSRKWSWEETMITLSNVSARNGRCSAIARCMATDGSAGGRGSTPTKTVPGTVPSNHVGP